MRLFLLDPFGEPHNAGQIFESPFGLLRDQLAKNNIRLDTYDQGNLADADKVLFFNYNQNLYKRCVSLRLPPEKLVLFAFEPSVVMPQQYAPSIWNLFGMIFTQDDTRLDDTRVFKLRYPQGKSLIPDTPSFQERKPLILINSNKYSYEAGELYSLRRQAIRYFEVHEPGFDLYGHGWRRGLRAPLSNLVSPLLRHRPQLLLRDALLALKSYPSYRGSVADKYVTLASYRFCICFENEAKTPGYITEKIFDCLVCGTIPVYLGAPNITDYVPAEAFIDMRKFTDFSDLASYMNSLTEERVAQMRKVAEDYLQSPAFEQWQPKAVFDSIARVLI